MTKHWWNDIAEDRGFRDNGDRTWQTPNGHTVSEGYVARSIVDVALVLLAVGSAPTPCQRRYQRASKRHGYCTL